MPDPIPAVCDDAATRWIECVYGGQGPTEGYAEMCSCFLQLGQDMYGAECSGALEDYYACLAAAECLAIATGEACIPEQDAISAVCPTFSPS